MEELHNPNQMVEQVLACLENHEQLPYWSEESYLSVLEKLASRPYLNEGMQVAAYAFQLFAYSEQICEQACLIAIELKDLKQLEYYAHKLISLAPNSIRSLRPLTMYYLFKEDPLQTLETLEQRYNLGDRESDMFMLAVFCNKNLERYQQAWESFRISLQYEEPTPTLLHTVFQMRDYITDCYTGEKLVNFLQALVDLQPYCKELWFFAGAILLDAEEFARAKHFLYYARLIDPDCPLTVFTDQYVAMLCTISRRKRPKMKITTLIHKLEKLLVIFEKDPRYLKKFPTINFFKAVLYTVYAYKKYKTCLKFAHAILALDRSFAHDVYWIIAQCLLELKNYQQAIFFTEKAMDTYDHSASLWVMKGVAEAELGLEDASYESFLKATTCKDMSKDLWVSWLKTAYKHYEIEKALDISDHALEFYPQDVQFAYIKFTFLLQSGKTQLAFNCLQLALAENYQAHTIIFDFLPNLEAQKVIFKYIQAYKVAPSNKP